MDRDAGLDEVAAAWIQAIDLLKGTIHEKISIRYARPAARGHIGRRPIRAEPAGADGMPFGCRKILRRAYRQAAGDERVPARKQGQTFRLLPQGRGVPGRLNFRRPQCGEARRTGTTMDRPRLSPPLIASSAPAAASRSPASSPD